MTVYIEKPAVNLREELASLRNQGGYEEQQFWMDGLVTNGTFDTDTSGWTAGNATLSVVSNRLRITNNGAVQGGASQTLSLIVGQRYIISGVVRPYNGQYPRVYINGVQIFQAPNANSDYVFSFDFIATAASSLLALQQNNAGDGFYSDWDNISIFETDGTDVVHRMPKGWVPKDVYEDGLLQREGAAHDYEVVYDGFDYYVKPAVAPSATTQTCVIGVRK